MCDNARKAAGLIAMINIVVQKLSTDSIYLPGTCKQNHVFCVQDERISSIRLQTTNDLH